MEFLKSAFNYTGSKYPLLGQLVRHFPDKEEVDTFFDLFTGGGSVAVNVSYDRIVANDIIKPLIDFYNELQDREWEEIMDNLRPYILDREDKEAYMASRARFNEGQNPYHFFCLVQSCTNNMLRFNRKFEFNQTFGKRTFNPSTEKKLYDYWKRIGELNIWFTNRQYTDLLPMIVRSPDNFVYLDPPYLITEAGYNAFWSRALEDSLYDFMDTLDGHGVRFAMSNVARHKGVRNPYMDRLSRYNIVYLDHNYDKVSRKDAGLSQEILVKNY